MALPFHPSLLSLMFLSCLWESSKGKSENSTENIAFNSTARHGQCPIDAWTYENACVFAIPSHHLWQKSREKCWEVGADLVTSPDKTKTNFLISSFVNQFHQVWVGASKMLSEKEQFEWVDGTELPTTTDWYEKFYMGHCVLLTVKGLAATPCNVSSIKEFDLKFAICEVKDATLCNWDNGGCNQICTPINGSNDRNCSCRDGFVLVGYTDCKSVIKRTNEIICDESEEGCDREYGDLEMIQVIAGTASALVLIIVLVMVYIKRRYMTKSQTKAYDDEEWLDEEYYWDEYEEYYDEDYEEWDYYDDEV